MARSSESKRRYESPLREQHAAETREAIVDAIVAEIAGGGLAELSVPRVAERASVSVRTVYRYFPTREDLVAAADEAWTRLAPNEDTIESLEDVLAHIGPLFRYFGENADALEAAMQTAFGRQVRERGARRRTERARHLMRTMFPHLDERELRLRAAIVRLVGGSAAWRTLTRELGLSSDEAADAAAWALRVLVDATRADHDARAASRGRSAS